jgi:hypothetical protein
MIIPLLSATRLSRWLISAGAFSAARVTATHGIAAAGVVRLVAAGILTQTAEVLGIAALLNCPTSFRPRPVSAYQS